MQPRSDPPPADPVKNPKILTPTDDDDYPELPHHHHRGGGGSPTAAFHGLHHYLSARPRAWLVVSILAIQLLLLLSARSIPAPRLGTSSTSVDSALHNSNDSAVVAAPPSLPAAATVTSSPAAEESPADDEAAACEYGRVYVYDLPAVFNRELVDACDDLNPWTSTCDALSNGGFGQPSADLAGFVPDALLPSWYATDQFAAELIYHRRLLADRCRTLDPSAAAAFYIPFYGGLAVGKYLWSEKENYTARHRDRHARMLLRWIRDREPWRKSQGRDHFIVLGRITWDFRRSGDGDWGGSFLHMPGMKWVTRLLIERNPWDDRDVGVPYPTGFHPRSSADLRAWQDFVLSRPRSTLFCFAGVPYPTGFHPRNNVRPLFIFGNGTVHALIPPDALATSPSPSSALATSPPLPARLLPLAPTSPAALLRARDFAFPWHRLRIEHRSPRRPASEGQPAPEDMASESQVSSAIGHNERLKWDQTRIAHLTKLLVEHHRAGKRASTSWKPEAWKNMRANFNNRFGLNVTTKELKARVQVMKNDYGVIKNILNASGFGFNPMLNTFSGIWFQPYVEYFRSH